MKNTLIALVLLFPVLDGFGQFKTDRLNAGIALNTTTYLFQGDIKPGLQAGIGYDITDKVGLYMSYLQNKTYGSNDDHFKADIVRLSTIIRIKSTYKSKFSFYVPIGVSFLSMKEVNNKIPYRQNGVTLDLPVGFQLKAGPVRVYSEIGVGVAITEYKAPSLLSGYDNLFAQVGIKVPFAK